LLTNYYPVPGNRKFFIPVFLFSFPIFGIQKNIFMYKKLFPGFIILFLCLASSAQKRNLAPADIYKLKATGGGLVSPDGKWFVYTLTSLDSAKNNRNTDLWMMSWDGKENIQLTNSPDGESNAKWSPDGKYISFMAARSGGNSQVYLLNRLGGEAIKLTDLKGDLSDYEWSPDSKKMVMTIRDPADTSKETKAKPWVIDRFHFKQDVAGYLYDKRKTHIYLYDVKEKKLDTLTRGNYDETSVQWNPEGSKLVFVSNRTEDPDKNSNTDIFVMDAKAGAPFKQITSWKGSDGSPQWSPDGKSIAYLRSTAEGNFLMYDQQVLCIVNAEGGEPKLLSKNLDRPVSNPRWNKQGNTIAALVTDDCRRYIAGFDPSSGKMTTLVEGDRAFSTLEQHPNGQWITSMSDPQTPPEFYALENGGLRRLTKIQDEFVTSFQLASVQKITSTSKDGAKISNLLFTPHGHDGKKMPAIFFIHGGPVGQDEFGFDLTRQMLAANGYAVVAVNYRGSNGRGLAHTRAIMADWGNKEVLDILGAADHLTTSGIIDGDRLGIGGWSYGGILTDYTIASDTRFKAACSGAGSALQLSLYGVDQYITQFENEIGSPWKDNNLDKYLKLSYPFLKADRIKTPTLFLTGEKDFNVPAIGSEQMYQALRSIGIPTGLIVYPGQFHGITTPSYQKDRLERYIGWYDQYLKKKSF
jgi:dipeptidyl aminopeptidase/acylaminoacyl peptidase